MTTNAAFTHEVAECHEQGVLDSLVESISRQRGGRVESVVRVKPLNHRTRVATVTASDVKYHRGPCSPSRTSAARQRQWEIVAISDSLWTADDHARLDRTARNSHVCPETIDRNSSSSTREIPVETSRIVTLINRIVSALCTNLSIKQRH